MHLVRRASTGALALATVFALAACSPQDNGNNTLVGRKSESPMPTGSAPAATGGPVALEAKDNAFVPKDIAAKAGDVTITFDNTGTSPHTFTNKDLAVDQNVDAGKKLDIVIKGAKAGTYKFVCKYHESAGMVGTLTVT